MCIHNSGRSGLQRSCVFAIVSAIRVSSGEETFMILLECLSFSYGIENKILCTCIVFIYKITSVGKFKLCVLAKLARLSLHRSYCKDKTGGK